MSAFLYVMIILFGTASYVVGVRQMLLGKYRPSVFSRVIWLLLAINSFAGVVLSHSSRASIVLASILLLGNGAICLTSFWKGSHEFGKLEIMCLILLAISVVIWLSVDAPLVNLAISLLAHFIGAAPTYRKVWRDPSSESTPFWALFFVASLSSVLASDLRDPVAIILPIYFAFFDGGMTLMSARKPAKPSKVLNYK